MSPAEEASPRPPRQRLFFALQPAPEIRTRLWRLARSLPLARERLTHPDDLHATLAFLGMVEADRLGAVTAVAAQIRAEPFTLQIDRLDYWPRPKVAWAGPSRVPPGLEQLVVDLWAGLASCGFEPETRPYRAHITLARKGGAIEAGTIEPPIPWEVGDFVLMQSLSVAEPPRYKVLQRWALGTARG